MPSVWLPYIVTGTGSDTFTRDLAAGLETLGSTVHLQPFPKKYEAVPFLLRRVAPPAGASAVLANSWNAFAFARPGLRLVTVEHLFVLDPAYLPFKSSFQRIAHESLLRRYLEWSYKASDALIAPSAYTSRAANAAFPKFTPSVIHNGVNTAFFSPGKRQDHFGEAAVRLLFVSSHSRRKGYDLLPSIIRELGGGYRLSVAGDREKDFAGPAHFLGRLDREGVRAAYHGSDILLMPTHLEGLPLAALEAMACGVPVVAFDASGMSEVVEHGRTGMLARENDLTGFIAAVRAIASDPGMLDRFRRDARRSAVERFDVRRMVQSYYDVLN